MKVKFFYELCEGKILEYSICPEQFCFKRAFHSEIIGSSAYENAKDLKDILSGKMQGKKFDLVILNAMFALNELESAFFKFSKDKLFKKISELLKTYLGRPTPLYFARNLSKKYQH